MEATSQTSAASHHPELTWLTEDYPAWDGFSPPHPRVAKAAYAYLNGCNLRDAIQVLLGEGPYSSQQVARVRHSRAFWNEVLAQVRQRKLRALSQASMDGSNQAAIKAASAAGELEGVVGKWVARIEEAHAKRKGNGPAVGGPEVAEW